MDTSLQSSIRSSLSSLILVQNIKLELRLFSSWSIFSEILPKHEVLKTVPWFFWVSTMCILWKLSAFCWRNSFRFSQLIHNLVSHEQAPERVGILDVLVILKGSSRFILRGGWPLGLLEHHTGLQSQQPLGSSQALCLMVKGSPLASTSKLMGFLPATSRQPCLQ